MNATILVTRFFFFFWLGSAFSKSEEKSILVVGRGTYPVLWMVRHSTITIPINAHFTSFDITDLANQTNLEANNYVNDFVIQTAIHSGELDLQKSL